MSERVGVFDSVFKGEKQCSPLSGSATLSEIKISMNFVTRRYEKFASAKESYYALEKQPTIGKEMDECSYIWKAKYIMLQVALRKMEFVQRTDETSPATDPDKRKHSFTPLNTESNTPKRSLIDGLPTSKRSGHLSNKTTPKRPVAGGNH